MPNVPVVRGNRRFQYVGKRGADIPAQASPYHFNGSFPGLLATGTCDCYGSPSDNPNGLMSLPIHDERCPSRPPFGRAC